MRDILEYIPYRLVAALIRFLPWRTGDFLGRGLGILAFDVFRIRRAVTLDNLRRAFPDKTTSERIRIGRMATKNLCISLLETFWFPRFTQERIRKIVLSDGIGIMEEKLKQGKGLIMMSGHFGNWELIALSVGMLCGREITIVVQEQRNKRVDRFLTRIRSLFGNKMIVMDKSPRLLLQVLKSNGIVAMLADQSAPRESIFVNYFGRPAATHRGPAIFSIRTGAPIIMAFLVRTVPGRYRIEFRPLETGFAEGVGDDEKVRIISERHVRVLEEIVREYPEHWLWMHKRWKHEQYAPAVMADAPA